MTDEDDKEEEFDEELAYQTEVEEDSEEESSDTDRPKSSGYNYDFVRFDGNEMSILGRQVNKRPPLSHDKEIEIFQRLETKYNNVRDILLTLGVSTPFLRRLLIAVQNGVEKREAMFSVSDLSELRELMASAVSYHREGDAAYASGDETKLQEVRETLVTICRRFKLKTLAYDRFVYEITRMYGKAIKTRNPERRAKYESRLWCSVEEFTETFKRIRTILDEISKIKHLIVESNIRLVLKIAHQQNVMSTSFNDIVQEGCIGLLKAVDRFEYARGYKFSTYATWYIRQGVTKAINDNLRAIRLPSHVLCDLSTVVRVARELTVMNGAYPAPEEIALATKFPVEKVKDLLNHQKRFVSVDSSVSDDSTMTFGDTIDDPFCRTPSEEVAFKALCQRVQQAISGLAPREREVIRRRFGIDDGHPMTLEDIGKILGLTRERVRQIEAGALRKLRGASSVSIYVNELNS